ncbi:tetratricopeptide repeat protein [Candidatus Daviesbacteria bacterium]|nr:tetratricopeptide repeat protein [Candidatus Daviesbacteria bacterium]
MRNLLEILKADKRLLILVVAGIILIAGGSLYAYYNSESRVIERLVKQNPRGEEFAKVIADSNQKLNESGLSSKERIDALLSRAVAKEALGDKRGAVEDYEEILKINAAHPIARSNLAGIFTSFGKYEDAEFQYLAIVATQPLQPDAYIRLAELYEGYFKGKEDLIPAVLTYAMEQAGKQPIFLEKLAQYYFDRKFYVQALNQIDELLKVDPQNELGKSLLEEIQKKS